jgi:hypothetical protein
MRLRAAALCALLLVAGAAPAQEPPAGVEHDSWRRIELSPVAGGCLELASASHAIRLSLGDLRAMALDAGSVMGASAQTGLRRIFEERAQAFLGRIAKWPAGEGCVLAQALDGGDRYVVAELLKAGRAEVRAGAANAASIWMRHLGRRTGPLAGHGEILFYVQRGGEPFFTVSWWVA